MVVALERPREEPLLTIGQAARLAGVHRNTLRNWCATGRLPSVRVTGRGGRVVRQDELEALLSQRTAPSRPRGRRADGSLAGRPAAAARARPAPSPDGRADALRRIAAEVSARLDLQAVFEDVLDASQILFATPCVALWLVQPGDRPFRLAAQRGLDADLQAAIAAITVGDHSVSALAIERRELRVVDARDATTPRLAELYRRDGILTVCFVPIVFRDEPLGLLVLYSTSRRSWPREELDLARAFADQMATAIQTARLYSSVNDQAARLQAIGDLGLRLNSITDVDGIGGAIMSAACSLIEADSVRVYRVDHEMQTCEPIGSAGTFRGRPDPTPGELRRRIGEGLSGWVAANGLPLLTGDAWHDPRVAQPPHGGLPESVLSVPMLYEGVVRGVVTLSRHARDAFSRDDLATLSVFAGYAGLALANAESRARLDRQQATLEQQLVSQRRLLEVNERLLAARDPEAVLELIADVLKELLSYDTLTVHVVDRGARVRRAVVARGRFAEQIIDTEAPLGAGLTGWVLDHAEAIKVDDALHDPRAIQVPGTPPIPEAMVVVPLVVSGEAIGTLNVARIGEESARFSDHEFELTKLFAGQASVALGNAAAHREAVDRADLDALTGLGNHGAFQRAIRRAVAAGEREPFSLLMLDLDAFKALNDGHGHPAGDDLLRRIAGALRSATAPGDGIFRYGGDEFAVLLPGADRALAGATAERVRCAVAEAGRAFEDTPVTTSVGVACFPVDGLATDTLVGVADRALYLAKARRSNGMAGPALTRRSRYDPVTGLPNRRELAGRLTELIVGLEGGAGWPLDHAPEAGFVLLDVDRSAVRNSLGAGAADDLLEPIAARLRSTLRPSDFVGRMGHDRFGIVLAGLDGPAAATAIADRLRAAFAEPFRVHGRAATCAASLGVATVPASGHTAAEIMHAAQLALRRARTAGAGTPAAVRA